MQIRPRQLITTARNKLIGTTAAKAVQKRVTPNLVAASLMLSSGTGAIIASRIPEQTCRLGPEVVECVSHPVNSQLKRLIYSTSLILGVPSLVILAHPGKSK